MRLSGTNLERAGDHNQRVTLHAIRVNSPITRAELAKITGLTSPAIANITKRLLADKLIQDAGRRRGGRGQPATKLVINPDAWFSIGLNVDRDHITMVLLDFEGRVRARASREVAFAMPDDVEQFFRKGVGKLLSKVGIGRDRLAGVGVALPDDMPKAAKLPHQPADYGVWASTDVAALLMSALNVPVFVENDAAAAAMGEMQFGLGKKHQTFFYILITAALGGSLVIEGNHFRGASGRSGELGMLRGRDATGHERQIQNIVSLSALYSRLAAQGIRVSEPHDAHRARRGWAGHHRCLGRSLGRHAHRYRARHQLPGESRGGADRRASARGHRRPAGDATQPAARILCRQCSGDRARVARRVVRRCAGRRRRHPAIQPPPAADAYRAHEGGGALIVFFPFDKTF